MTDDAGPTKERLRKAGDEVEDFITDTGKRTKRMQDVLDMLASRRVITGDQYTAGRQLYEDWYQAGLAASGVIDPAKEVVDGGRMDNLTDRVLDATGRFTKALVAVGKIHSNALINIVLMGEALVEYGWRMDHYKDTERAKLAAIIRLKAALSELDNHYYGQRRTKSGASHIADYRPVIQPAS